MLPELTDEQAQTLRDGGPTGHLVDDVLAVTLDCLHADDGTPADFRTFLLPIADYTIEDVWHTVGLRGTGVQAPLTDVSEEL